MLLGNVFMKIGIVTIYNSQNCGSFLQALALLSFLKKAGYDVAIAGNKMYYKNRITYKLLLFLKYFFCGQKDKAKRIIKTSINFRKTQKKHLIIRSLNKNDVCIYGSDTIWNSDSEYFGKQWKHYWGKSFNGKKIAYAPSIGPTVKENILNDPKLCKCIKEFSKISVRDENTYEVVCGMLGDKTEIEYVIDPTMLMTKEFYQRIASTCNESNFILFYYFGRVEKQYMDEIKKYAEANGKKLICFGDNISGVDKQICFNPLDMMAYYSKADMIITNTFHGNVFSIIFNKPFINIDAGKNKVNDLLNAFELSERTVNKGGMFNEIVSKAIDYEKVNAILEEKRKSSGAFLKTSIEECERGLI
jgi:polysaccharide pyruvyl transferase WcaK-like protein